MTESPLQKPPGGTASRQREMHLKEYMRVVSARRWVLVGTFVLVVLLAVAWVAVQKPMYRAEAQLLIESQKANLSGFQVGEDLAAGPVGSELARRDYMETQYQLVLARPLLAVTFERFRFAAQREFATTPDPVTTFGKLFAVSPVRRSSLAWVTFDWRNPELAAQVLDYHLKQFIAEHRQRSMGITMEGLRALKDKAEGMRPKVQSAADALQQFMVEHGTSSFEDSQNTIVDTLKGLNRSLEEAQRRRFELESNVADTRLALDQRRALEDMPEVAQSEAVRDLKMEYIRAKQEATYLAGRFGPRHPEVLATEARLKAVTDKMEAEIRSVLASVETQLDRARQQEERLKRQLAEQQQRVIDFNKLAGGYRTRKSAHETLNQTYRAVTRRIEEIEIAMATGSKNDTIFITSPPCVPVKPIRPRPLRTLFAAGIFALVFGVGLCFFFDYLDTSVKTQEDAERLLGVPVIGYVPVFRAPPGANGRALELLTVDHPRSQAAESFRSLRTALAFSSADGGLRRLMVTSSSPSEGKTLVSVNIAIALARTGKKTLLIDADLRKPRVHKLFRATSSPGLSNLLAREGATAVGDAARPFDGVDNLYYLPSGPVPPNPAELLGSPRMREIIAEAERAFDVIVFDTPPAAHVTDAVVLARQVDGALLVVRSFVTQRDIAQRSRDLLEQSQARLLGVVLNNVDVPAGAYGGYYGRYYYKYYGEDGLDEGRERQKKPVAVGEN